MVGAMELGKVDLRRRLLAARREIDAATYRMAGQAIRAHVAALSAGHRIIAAYVPLPTEPGGPAADFLAALGDTTILVPCLLPDNDLDWAIHDGQFEPGPRGLSEPPGPRLGAAAITSADLVIAPATAVDHAGNRLGRGGGSYDRALARAADATEVAAVVYDHEILDHVPHDAHDRPVTMIISPDGVRRVS